MKINILKYISPKQIYHIPELVSNIIKSMQDHGYVHLYSQEAYNLQKCGLYDLLDQLCSFWNWDKSKIILETGNPLENHPFYKNIFSKVSHPVLSFDTTAEPIAWNKEKYYGMFIGRASAVRIYAGFKHKNFKYSSMGLTSFIDNLYDFMNTYELTDYFFHSNQTYREMLELKPYSDIKNLVSTPARQIITPPFNSNSQWKKVYEKIAIDIVCETNTDEGVQTVSEKLLRPLYYKRPFLLISSPRSLEYLRGIGFKTFDNYIDESYDTWGDYTRVDMVFERLHYLIESGEILTLNERCKEILEYNHAHFLKTKKEHALMGAEIGFKLT